MAIYVLLDGKFFYCIQKESEIGGMCSAAFRISACNSAVSANQKHGFSLTQVCFVVVVYKKIMWAREEGG